MDYYEKIMMQQPCTTEKRVRGFVQSLEAGDVTGLVKYNFDWVAAYCFTPPATVAYREAIAPAEAAYWKVIAQAEGTYRKATAPVFLALAAIEGSWK